MCGPWHFEVCGLHLSHVVFAGPRTGERGVREASCRIPSSGRTASVQVLRFLIGATMVECELGGNCQKRQPWVKRLNLDPVGNEKRRPSNRSPRLGVGRALNARKPLARRIHPAMPALKLLGLGVDNLVSTGYYF